MSRIKKGVAPIPEPRLECRCISKPTKAAIEKLALASVRKWLRAMAGKNFSRDNRPKEAGHNNSGKVEELIRKGVSECFPVRASSMVRSSGDFFVTIANSEYPFNSKLSIFDRQPQGGWNFGQPNLCAVNRIFYNFLSGRIQQYVVLYASVWVELDGTYKVKTHLVDILHYPQFITADMGPGQCMTKAKALYTSDSPAPLLDRRSKEDALLAIRSATSVSGVDKRIYQCMIDHVEIALHKIRRTHDLEEVSTQKLRQATNFKKDCLSKDSIEGWELMRDLERRYQISRYLDRDQDKSLFLEYIA